MVTDLQYFIDIININQPPFKIRFRLDIISYMRTCTFVSFTAIITVVYYCIGIFATRTDRNRDSFITNLSIRASCCIIVK